MPKLLPNHHDFGNPGLRRAAYIKEWIQRCEEKHDNCKRWRLLMTDPRSPFSLPSRLLCLTLHGLHPSIYLCETAALPRDSKYATLSHCWGSSQPIRLLKGNHQEFLNGIALSSLPKTFREAITLCVALDIEYLWIDSLCIIQDSKADWLQEATQMAAVYANSWLNIAATASQDCHGGLFFGNPFGQPASVIATWNLLPGCLVCYESGLWERYIENAPLNRRAWVFQERILSI